MNNLIINCMMMCLHYMFMESMMYMEWNMTRYTQVHMYWMSFFSLWYLMSMNFSNMLMEMFVIILMYYWDNINNNLWFEMPLALMVHSFWLIHVWLWVSLYLYYNMNKMSITKEQIKFVDMYMLLLFIVVGFLWAYNIFSFMLWWFLTDNVELFIFFIFYLSFFIYHKGLLYYFDKSKYLDGLYMFSIMIYGLMTVWTWFHINWNYYSFSLTIYSFLSCYFLYNMMFYWNSMVYKIQKYQCSNSNCQVYFVNLILGLSMVKFAYLYLYTFNLVMMNMYFMWTMNMSYTMKYMLFITIYMSMYLIDMSMYCMLGVFVMNINNYIYKHCLYMYLYWAFISILNLQLNMYNYLLLMIWWLGLFMENSYICMSSKMS